MATILNLIAYLQMNDYFLLEKPNTTGAYEKSTINYIIIYNIMNFYNTKIHKDRLQPVGLISLSCYWVILYIEMIVQIQLNPTGKPLHNKNVSKINSAPDQIVSCKKKSYNKYDGDFTPSFNDFEVLNKTLNKQRIFKKKG